MHTLKTSKVYYHKGKTIEVFLRIPYPHPHTIKAANLDLEKLVIKLQSI
jgi:hypothetical protein